MTKLSLTDIALDLLESWRQYLVSVRDDIDDGGESLGHFIDVIERFRVATLAEDFQLATLADGDTELVSSLRLILGLNSLTSVGLEPAEHNIVIDAHSEAMMRLANVMSSRGHHCILPKVLLR